jgi:uncharacterized membrane protein
LRRVTFASSSSYRTRGSSAGQALITAVYAVGAVVVGAVLPRIERGLPFGMITTISAQSGIAMYSAIASGMLALTGIVFSLMFVMVQFSATAFSPRLVLWVARGPFMSHALGVFTATFLYAISALAWVDRENSGRVPGLSAGLVVVLLLCSVGTFAKLVQRVGLLQIQAMLAFTGDMGREAIARLYPPLPARLAAEEPVDIPATEPAQTVVHRGRPRTLQAIDADTLVEIARTRGALIAVVSAVGDTLVDGSHVMLVFGTERPIDENALRRALTVGEERAFEEDPLYAIRLLVDIAIKALSPAVNDPTTAVQALDQIEDLLRRLGNRFLQRGAFRDQSGTLRVVVQTPEWEDFLRLGLDEIEFYGAQSVQVMRRMRALLGDLLAEMPNERRPALVYWNDRLQATIARAFGDAEEALVATRQDRQGLGVARRFASNGRERLVEHRPTDPGGTSGRT